MEKMNNLWEKILRLSEQENGDLAKRFVKLTEEVGEFSAAFLEEDGFKIQKTSKTKEELREHVLEEGVDTIIMVLDIFANKGFSSEEITNMMEKKLISWENVLVEKGLIPVDEDINWDEIIPQESESPIDDELLRRLMASRMSEEYDEDNLIQNAMKCLECDTIIQSRSRHDYVECGCPNGSMVDGGLVYARYGGHDLKKLESFIIDHKTPFEEVKEKLVWGTYGKKGDQPLKYVPLINCTTDHLHAILKNVKNLGPMHEAVMVSILKDRGDLN